MVVVMGSLRLEDVVSSLVERPVVFSGTPERTLTMRRCVIALAVLGIVAAAVPVGAQEQLYLHLMEPGRPFDPTWPPDGAPWHELHPTYCNTHTQTGHEDDNGNGQMDVCENFTLDGVRYHIEWVGPTYVLTGGVNGERPETIYCEGGDPTRQYLYHEIYPNFCDIFMVWDPIEFVCQDVYIEPGSPHEGWWHVEEIGTNVIVTPNPLNPVEDSTWSKIKSFFRNLLSF
jgi:hypothetical protein